MCIRDRELVEEPLMSQLIVHGGAGDGITGAERVREGIALVLQAGIGRLQEQGSLEAVIQIVQWMEDNPIFNCGTGSTLNLGGEAEMDAVSYTHLRAHETRHDLVCRL